MAVILLIYHRLFSGRHFNIQRCIRRQESFSCQRISGKASGHMCDANPAGNKISVVILNYNSRQWLPRCFESLERQTIFKEIEVIVADNASTDGSDVLADEWLRRSGCGQLVRNGTNLYFCKGNNAGASVATGEFILFLNPDLWLEDDCLEKLYQGVVAAGADAGTPVVLEYDDVTFQSCGAPGFDLFGMPTSFSKAPAKTTEEFIACGCSLLVRTEMFRKIGGFPPEFLMYSEETDVCWRVWVAGGKVVVVPEARLHHRGAVAVNPAGETKTIESRTSETKRYLANRNGILLIAKNAQHVLLLLLLPHLLLLLLEAFVSLLWFHKWRFIQKSYLAAIGDAFRMRGDVSNWRRTIRGFRNRNDFQMLRFLRLRPARWDEVKRLFHYGPPKVDAR